MVGKMTNCLNREGHFKEFYFKGEVFQAPILVAEDITANVCANKINKRVILISVHDGVEQDSTEISQKGTIYFF